MQDYYDITSDMSEEEMRSIAAENLEAKMSFLKEQRLQASLINPLHLLISRLIRKKQKTTFF